jgi:2-oxoglutarate dehydrogenase E2 component (dihydrolipoamide succinyltransferase)
MAIDLVVPALGESISEAVISKWLKQVGEPIGVDEPVVDLETDKVSVALPAPAAGVLAEQRFAVGATVKVGEIVGSITAGPEIPIAKNPAAPKEVPPPAAFGDVRPEKTEKVLPTPTVAGANVPTPVVDQPSGATLHTATLPQPSHPSPTVRKALREGATPGTNGAPAQHAYAPPSAPTPTGPIAPTVAGPGEEVVPLSPLRKKIAERLVAAQHTAAILTTFNEVDMSAVMALRAKYQESFVARHGIKLGFMSLFVRACVESLRNWPGLNAELRGNDIIYKKRYHFGIAVGSGRGLVVPVVRDVDQMSLAEIEKQIAEKAQKAKDNKLTLDELSGGTFSITNGGIYGSMMSTPLLNMPQTGILGMHNITKRPVAVGDSIELRPMMYVALSYDHRVVDGREAVSFLVGVKERLEAPDRMLLEI